MVGYGEPDPNDPQVLKDAIANAIDVSKLEALGGVFYLTNTQEPFSGFAKQLYESGQYKELTQLKNGEADGLYKEWYEDGSKLSECTYVNGKKHGTDTVWRSDGSKVREISYKKGEKHGQEVLYNLDGSKWSETSYLKGKKHGDQILTLEDSEFYEKHVHQYKNGKANGMAIAFNKDGSRKWETVWENDKFISTKRFKATPTADKTYEIKADQLEQRRGVWYAKGKAEQFNGASVTYYPNGSKKINYLYINGKKHGPATLYNEDGTEKSSSRFKDGERVFGEGQRKHHEQDDKPITTKLISTPTRKTVAGTGKMEGWVVYEPTITVEREKAQLFVSGNESIEGAIIQFFASLMRGDKDFEAILSPTMKASVRERFITEMPGTMTNLNQVSILGHTPFELAAKHRVAGKMAIAGREIFGDFDSMVFCEGNTNRDDIPVLLVQYEGKWYVAGIISRQFEILLDSRGGQKTVDAEEDKGGTKKKRAAYKEAGLSVSNESKPDIGKLAPQEVFGGKYHEVKRKLENGADPDAILLPKAKRTALHCCCMGGRVNIVKLLLANGAKPNVLDRSNMAPLDILFSPDEKGRAPLERMSAENQLEIQRMLEKAGGKRKRHPKAQAHVQKATRRSGETLADFLPGKKIYYWSPPPGQSLQKNKRPNSVLRFSKEGPWDMGLVFSDKEVFPLSDLPEVLAKQVYAVDGLQVELGGEMMAGVKAGIIFSSANPRKGEEMVLTTEGQKSLTVTISWISGPGVSLPDDLQFDSQEVSDATVRDDAHSQRPKPKNIKASLWDATLLGWKSVVQQHVDAGTDLNEVFALSSPPETALDMAIRENQDEIAHLLRENGAMTVKELKAKRDK
jgi:antitoxin component YwqK of YwqJK toxin-antitoxin module/ankyrin repeat protein